MPRNVRNFWIELGVDGRISPIETGPQVKDGGFTLHIYQRDRGEMLHVLTVLGLTVTSEGKLSLLVLDERGSDLSKHVLTIDTER